MKNNIKTAKKLIIFVDIDNGFTKEGNMADKYIQHIIPESKKLLEHFLKMGYAAAFVEDWHDKNSVEFLRYLVHCKGGTYEAQMVDELLPFESKVLVFHKNATCAMFAPGFMEMLAQMECLKEIVIVGCCTDFCVMHLAIPLQCYFDEHNRVVKIIIPKNAVETFDAPNHPRDEYNEMAFKLMAQMGIEIVDSYM